MKHGVPYVIAFVLALAFLLLLVAFRSIVVPLKAIVLNLLSVGAAYGVLVLVFQHTWAEPLLGFESNGAIISWLPLFLFVVLFGLSMDYHVFILSRVREAVDGGMATDDAVRYGITITAGVVTSAALVMVGVFSLFGSLSSLDVKQAGVGLAAAVLIDATIVRAVLLPSSMTLLGEWNWYLPRFLERLPKAPIEAPPARRAALADAQRLVRVADEQPRLRAAADHVDRCRPARRRRARGAASGGRAAGASGDRRRRTRTRCEPSRREPRRRRRRSCSPTVAAPVPPRATGTGVSRRQRFSPGAHDSTSVKFVFSPVTRPAIA